jgi:drug/metabolite transporter (DMT)-like permease
MIRVEASLNRRAVMIRGVGVILLSSFLFGAMAVCVRLATQEMASSQVAFFRFAGSLIVLLAVGHGQQLRPRPGNAGRVLLRGLLGAASIVLYYHGIQGAGAGFATLLQNTYPVFTALFATTLMGERLGGRLASGLALDLVGVFIVLGPSAHVSPATMAGGVSALGAAVLAGGAVATARQLRISEGAFLITTHFMAIGTAFSAPALLLGLPSMTLPLAIALAGVVLTSVAGQMLLHQGLGFTAATQGSLAAATSVITAAALEAAFLGEHLSAHTLLGACLMITAVGLAVSHA